MSSEVYIQCFEHGKPAGMSRKPIRDAFGDFLRESEPNQWTLDYGGKNSCTVLLQLIGGDIHHLTVERPCADKRLWDSLASILKLGNMVFYFPGDAPPLVANDSVIEHLPPDMIKALGEPVVIRNGKDIVEQIETT
jgi:hypothetical protein